ncbi:MAG: hypothetical protein QNJ19_09000 [Woeseiaceae bacterium]|nr:hypothetical protein [Woeseiaceae bacterium]
MNKSTLIKASLSAISLAMLAGCGATGGSNLTVLGDGTTALAVECDGTPRGLNFCFELAGKSCGAQGYTIFNQAGESIGKSDYADAGTDRLIRQQAEDENRILIRCGSS